MSETQTPSPWTVHLSDDGRKYYYNSVTNVSVWDKPDELKTEEERLRDSVPWKEHKTSDGKVYYYNPVTKVTTWDCPPDLVEILKKIAVLRGDTKTHLYDEIYASMDDAKAAFKQLLRDCNVPSTATWEVVTKMTNHDARFNALKQTNEKKKVFNTYKQIKANEEKQEEKVRIKESISHLKEFLLANPLITSHTRYSRAHSLFRTQEIWYSVPDRDRRDLLDEIQPILSKKEREAEKEAARVNQNQTTKFFKKFSNYFPVTTKWLEALEIINDLNLTKKYKRIQEILENEKESALMGFEAYIYKLEEFYEKEQTAAKYLDRKQSRLNREKFTLFLTELYEQDKINTATKWKDIWPILKEDQRTLALLGQSGSSPLDLFKFFVYNLKGRHHDRKIIKKLIKSYDLKLDSTVTFNDFVKMIEPSTELQKMDRISALGSYNRVLKKIIEKQEYRKLKKDPNHQRACKEFYDLLKLLEPPLKANTKWEEIWPHLVKEPEYITLNNEPERVRIFKKFTSRVAKRSEVKRKKDRVSSSEATSSDSSPVHSRKYKDHAKSPARDSSPKKKKTHM